MTPSMPRAAPVFALATGLAVGFVVARQLDGCRLSPPPAAPAAGSPGPRVEAEPSPSAAAEPTAPATGPVVSVAGPPAPAAEPASPVVPLTRHNARRGTTGAKATVVELIDFTSPACQQIEPTLNRLRDSYPTELAVVVLQLPGDDDGPAMAAALAMQAALRQRKHWEMHDRMLASSDALGPDDLERYAAELGLDVPRFERDMADPAVRQEVDADRAVARALGVPGAPAFYVNCRKLEAAPSFEAFKQLIDPEIARGGELLAGGVKDEELYRHLCQRP